MIVPITKLKEAVEQVLREVNDACYQMRQEGVNCLLPEEIAIEAVVVTDINGVSRVQVESENDGSVVTVREQLAPDTETQTASGERTRSERTPTAQNETQTITHPSVTTAGSGADSAEQEDKYEYEEA